jgi:hypothetical protein
VRRGSVLDDGPETGSKGLTERSTDGTGPVPARSWVHSDAVLSLCVVWQWMEPPKTRQQLTGPEDWETEPAGWTLTTPRLVKGVRQGKRAASDLGDSLAWGTMPASLDVLGSWLAGPERTAQFCTCTSPVSCRSAAGRRRVNHEEMLQEPLDTTHSPHHKPSAGM